MTEEKPSAPSITAIAQLLCITPRRVQQLVKEGVLRKDTRGQYPLVTNVQGYIRYLQEESRQGAAGSPEMRDSKVRHAAAKADRAEMEVQRLRGELVGVQEVIEAWANIFTLFKSRMRAIPSDVAPTVRLAKTDGQAQELLRQLIDDALRELSETAVKVTPGFKREPQPQDPG